MTSSQSVTCSPRLVLTALPDLPIVGPGDNLVPLILAALTKAEIQLTDGDILVVTSKLFSRTENRFVDLTTVIPSEKALEIAEITQKDPRLVHLILAESESVSRAAPGVLVVRHRLGFIVANAGIDASNVLPQADPRAATTVLLLPMDPDASAKALRRQIMEATGGPLIGIVVTDSHGRPFRLGTVGAAIGIAGMPALWDQRGAADLFGRPLQITVTALGDQIAAAADLVAGQAAEGRPVVHIRGLTFPPADGRATDILRSVGQDLYS